MSSAVSLASSLRGLVGVVAVFGLLGAARAAPVFTTTYHAAALGVGLGWSSDLGPDVVEVDRNFPGTSTPITKSAVATRDGRTIAGTITQTAPYVLADQYWAASWSGTLDVPGPGLYGLFASAFANGHWNFHIPGQTPAEDLATQFYFAELWDVVGATDIHPQFNSGARPLSGSQTGNFTVAGYNSFGIPGFPTVLDFSAATQSLDSNLAGRVGFSYQIAFSTTPIDASVFAPSAVPEPGTWALALLGVAALVGHRHRVRS